MKLGALLIVPSLALAVQASAHEPRFREHDLVSDIPGRADHTDGNLVNPWGLVANPAGGPFWVADNGSGLSTLYDRDGDSFPIASPLVVTLEGPASPTGIVFQGSDDFVFCDHKGDMGPARFIWATEDGFIEAWNQNVPPPMTSTQAFIVVDNSTKGCRKNETVCGSVYKGLAIATDDCGETRLFATDFRNGRVDVFDNSFNPVELRHAFEDRHIPDGFAPFGIAALHDRIFVTYAVQDDMKHDDVAGPGNGFVDEFDFSGHFIRRVASHGALNSPWGLAFAPDGWGRFSDHLLVGNFGDGHINVFEPRRFGQFEFVDALENERGRKIFIDGLWSIVFGPGNDVAGSAEDLFFTAGLNGEANGLFGKITRAR